MATELKFPNDPVYDHAMEYLENLKEKVMNCSTKEQWLEFYVEVAKLQYDNRFTNPPKDLYQTKENRNSVLLKFAEVNALGLKKELELGIEIGNEANEMQEIIQNHEDKDS